jgi:FixJ family two-component response regulator
MVAWRPFGQRGADDDRRRALGHDLLEEGQAVHARHFDVEHDHVRPLASASCPARRSGRRRRDDLDVGLELRYQEIDLPMIFISSYPEVPSVVRAMRGGALDFFQKPFAPQQVLDRIQDGLRIDKARSHRQARSRAIGERMALLTPREKEVLQGVFEGKLTKTIAHDLGISQRTAETYRHLMMEKLQAGSVAELVRLTIEFLPAHDSP